MQFAHGDDDGAKRAITRQVFYFAQAFTIVYFGLLVPNVAVRVLLAPPVRLSQASSQAAAPVCLRLVVRPV